MTITDITIPNKVSYYLITLIHEHDLPIDAKLSYKYESLRRVILRYKEDDKYLIKWLFTKINKAIKKEEDTIMFQEAYTAYEEDEEL